MAKSSKLRKISKKRRPAAKPFPIVGIGASAGGLEALSDLLQEMPKDPGVALVVIQHLDPTHASMTTELLARKSKMPVAEVKSGVRARPNHVYILPPNRNMEISGGVLTLVPRPKSASHNYPINYFFNSLAVDQKEMAIGVVLSGTASDGAHGLEAIKGQGGTAIAQDPKSAKYSGMPRAAIATGVVDMVLPTEEIARELIRLAGHPLVAAEAHVEINGNVDDLNEILSLVESQCHVNFKLYRQSTIKRRISRRMILCRAKSLNEYLQFLNGHPNEVKELFSDLLINVTEFFRDPKIFAGLKTQIFPKLLKAKDKSGPLRIWVVGCATGEEAYSVAISLLEYREKVKSKFEFQIFATDISESSLQRARIGEYPPDIARHVDKDRLEKFFTVTESGYKVKKAVRELCVFSRHDVTRDPPFAKLDLVCCRNLMIYFDPPLQRRVLSVFHYALKPSGLLWLGRSESAGQPAKLFSVVDKAKKFYARKPARLDPQMVFPASRYIADVIETIKKPKGYPTDSRDIQREADRLALIEYAPPAVVVNDEMEIVSTRGDTTPYIQLPTGEASLNLYKMARPEIVGDLRMAIQSARAKMTVATKQGLTLAKSRSATFSIRVIPIKSSGPAKDCFFQICFEPGSEAPKRLAKQGDRKNEYVKSLERKLAEAKAYQESLISDFEMAQEELTSANEEMQSANEEFQSTNEELETAKEELQSANEELTTINDELAVRNAELDRTNNDLVNFFASVDIPVVMVGLQGEVRRFTPKAGRLMKLIPGDIGRPIGDIRSIFGNVNLVEMIAESIETISLREVEVQDPSGPWYRLQVRPYKTVDNKIDGAVVTLIDIDVLKRSLQKTAVELEFAMAVADSVQLPLVVVDEKLQIESVNRAFNEKLGQGKDFCGQDLLVTLGAVKLESLKASLREAFHSEKFMPQQKCHVEIASIGARTLLVGARKIVAGETNASRLLVSVEDITQRERLLASEREARVAAEKAVAAKDIFLSTLSHELRTPLNAILSWAQLIQMETCGIEKVQYGLKTIELNAKVQARLVDDLLDLTRIRTGKLAIHAEATDPAEVTVQALDSVRLLAERKNISIEFDDRASPLRVWADPIRLQQIVWNLVTNAIKFSERGQKINVLLEPYEENGKKFISIRVKDWGKGIGADFLPHIFQRFAQAEQSHQMEGGLGLGLTIAYDLLKIQGGWIRAESQGLGKGATFIACLPVDRPAGLKSPEGHLGNGHKFKVNATGTVNLAGLNILIVDDNYDSLEILGHTLEFFGARVVSCSRAADALKSLDGQKFDLIISDISMPGEDGYDFIRKVRLRPADAGGNTPAIALSAYVASEDVQKALKAGFQHHLAKPFDANSLSQVVDSLARKNPDNG